MPPAAGQEQPAAESNAAAPQPTAVPTATVWPPVFDPQALGDNRELDSFMLTRTDLTTGSGEEDDHTYTIGFISEPFNAFELHRFHVVGEEYFVQKQYSINGWSYKTNASYEWLIDQETSQEDSEYLREQADMRRLYDLDFGPVSADFAGQEDFQGIPAYHFTFDQTDLRIATDPSGTYGIEQAQGDLYLAQSGNYLLYFHIRMTGNLYFGYGPEYSPGVREYGEELTSINQLDEIAVPSEYLEPQHRLQELGLPLPADSALIGMERFTGGLGIDSYVFQTSLTRDAFLNYYENLAPTDGWTISHIGVVANHYRCGQNDCVIINKGGAQVILNPSDGGFIADYDRDHIYAPAPN
jgi:hypothetical protein